MEEIESPESLPADGRPRYVAIGSFDGVHVGHQRILEELTHRSRRDGALSLALTFRPHPRRVLFPDRPFLALSDRAEQREQIAARGCEYLLTLPFTPELARMPAERFIADLLCRRLAIGRIFVGYNFTFGKDGAGTPTLLQEWAPRCGFAVHVVPPVSVDGGPVSSTRIREAIRAGRVELAARLLGRPYALRGRVVSGDRRGRTLGFPTANLALPPEATLPARGVYAVRCRIVTDLERPGPPGDASARAGEQAVARRGSGTFPTYAGVANLGRRPTFGGEEERLEVHLFDFRGDLYGRELRVSFVSRLRGERRFAGVDALRRQIEADVAAARARLDGPPRPGE